MLPQDSEGSTTAGEEEEGEEREEVDGDFGNDFEPTQAYHFPVAEEEGESEREMDCEPTVAYNMEGVCVGGGGGGACGGEGWGVCMFACKFETPKTAAFLECCKSKWTFLLLPSLSQGCPTLMTVLPLPRY